MADDFVLSDPADLPQTWNLTIPNGTAQVLELTPGGEVVCVMERTATVEGTPVHVQVQFNAPDKTEATKLGAIILRLLTPDH